MDFLFPNNEPFVRKVLNVLYSTASDSCPEASYFRWYLRKYRRQIFYECCVFGLMSPTLKMLVYFLETPE